MQEETRNFWKYSSTFTMPLKLNLFNKQAEPKVRRQVKLKH